MCVHCKIWDCQSNLSDSIIPFHPPVLFTCVDIHKKCTVNRPTQQSMLGINTRYSRTKTNADIRVYTCTCTCIYLYGDMCDVSYYMCIGHGHTHEACKAISIASDTQKWQLHVRCCVCKLCVHSLLPHTVMNLWYDVVVLGDYLMQDGWTPLHAASLNGHRETVEVLVDHSADVNAREKVYNCMQWRFCLCWPSLRLCVHTYCINSLTLISSVCSLRYRQYLW